MRRALLFPALLLWFVTTDLEAAPTLRLTLPGALRLGLARNLDLVKQRLDIRFKRMAAGEAFRAFLPQVGFSFNRAITVRPHSDDSRQYRYEISVDQLLFDGGKVDNAHKMACADLRIAGRLLRIQERSVRLQILSAFAQAVGGRDQVRLYRRFLTASRKEVQLAALEVKLGTTTVLEHDEIATRYQSAQVELLESREAYYAARTALHKLLRIPLRRPVRLVGDVDEGFQPASFTLSEEELYAMARSRRLDFARSLLEYRKALFAYRSLQRSWLPDVSLSAKGFLSGPAFKPTERGYSVFLKLNFPLFGSPVAASANKGGGGEDSNATSVSFSPFQDVSHLRRLAQARSSVRFARLAREELPEDVRREIRLALSTLKLTRRRFLIRERQLDLLRKRLRILELKQKLGEARRLDLAKARIELYRALIDRSKQIVNYINTAFKLETAVGMLPGTLNLFRSRVFRFGG